MATRHHPSTTRKPFYENLVIPIDAYIRTVRHQLADAEWECAEERITGLRLDLDHALALIERDEQFVITF